MYICRKSDFEARDEPDPEINRQVPIIAVEDEIVDLETDFMLQSMDTLEDAQFPSCPNAMSNAPEFSQQDLVNNVQASFSQTPPTEQDVSSFFGVPKTRCPVCNNKFILSMIEEHVDACLKSKETLFLALQTSDE